MSSGVAEECARRDWVTGVGSYAVAWGIPTLALLVGIALPSAVRTIIWSTALIWMGVACILNALRCGRLHCYLTGPFFLLMAVVVPVHGFGIVWLGPNGWWWLAFALIAVGGGLLWYLPERMWRRYSRRAAGGDEGHV